MDKLIGKVVYIATGGFARGYRTYILSGLAVTAAIVQWSVGDASLHDTLQTILEASIGAGLGTFRAALPKA